jgi:hypothetical protein
VTGCELNDRGSIPGKDTPVLGYTHLPPHFVAETVSEGKAAAAKHRTNSVSLCMLTSRHQNVAHDHMKAANMAQKLRPWLVCFMKIKRYCGRSSGTVVLTASSFILGS